MGVGHHLRAGDGMTESDPSCKCGHPASWHLANDLHLQDAEKYNISSNGICSKRSCPCSKFQPKDDRGSDFLTKYDAFLRAKLQFAQSTGFEVASGEVNPLCMPHQVDVIRWAARGGRRAIFAAFGLGKSLMQTEIARLVRQRAGGRYLQVCPLGVRQEFIRDGHLDTDEFRRRASELSIDYEQIRAAYSIDFQFVQKTEQIGGDGFYLTNYESIRDHKIDISLFNGVNLDEASILRGFGGTKTFRELMHLFEGTSTYRFVATATPSPNEYIELLAYAAFLDIMDVGQAKTRFFKRNSEKADQLTLHPGKEREFWLWVSSWAIFLQRPSDLGYSDEGYLLPELDVHWHEIPTHHADAGFDPSGQGRLLKNAAIGVVDAAREKRDSLPARIDKMMEIRAIDPAAHRLIWHDLEAERHAIENALDSDSWATVWGSQDLDEREALIQEFSDGEIQELATKPVIAGSGCNFQRHCSWEIFLGIGFKFNDFIQAIHRCHRFLQKKRVRIDLIYTEAEREVRRSLERKWEQHKELTAEMTSIIREYGLATNALEAELARMLGVTRKAIETESSTLVHNDTVLESAQMPDDSAALILTSIPFSTQYEYSPSYNDFGHTDSNEHFWAQMDFLIPNLLRVLRPGRVAAIHVKDRIVPGGMTGLGFQTVYPFSDDCIKRFVKHGFGFLARKTIVTDVVRENKQTYRLGWTEQCKDGSRMGAGMPEYLLLFRKPPSDTSDGYADLPVVKEKAKYTRSRWQIDAHGFMRSSGERLLTAEDLSGVKHDTIFKLFRKYSHSQVYNYEHHVGLSESLERCRECGHIHTGMRKCGDTCNCPKSGGILPVTFMLLQPQSWHPDVWSDITRMRTLNAAQHSAGKEMHLCPLQFDIVDRVITQFSMEGETVFDPFMGIGTVPLCAVKLGRKGYGTELAAGYFQDAVEYVQEAERKASVPTLFGFLEEEKTA
jgi:DNA modification methylase